MFISNDHSILSNYLTEPNILNTIGKIEVGHFFKTKTFIYSILELSEDFDHESHLSDCLFRIQGFLTAFWLYKDNSVNQGNSYIIVPTSESPIIHTNKLVTENYSSDSEYNSCIINREDLRGIRKIFFKHLNSEEALTYKKSSMKLSLGESRLSMAIVYIQIARTTPEISLRLSIFISALEALFLSRSSGEVSHQLSERVAFFMNDNFEARLKLYKKIKSAYNYRSAAYHGSHIKHEKFKDVLDFSNEIEEISRAILNKILDDEILMKMFESGNVEEYMQKLLFNAGNP